MAWHEGISRTRQVGPVNKLGFRNVAHAPSMRWPISRESSGCGHTLVSPTG